MPLVVLIGASGAGKTTIARAIAARGEPRLQVFFFDSIGVPTPDQMIRDYGSGEAWQRAKTIEWMRTIAETTGPTDEVLFEGQTRFSFLAEGAAAAGLAFDPVLVDCDDETRARRLHGERGQPELANPVTADWARYLRAEALAHDHPILDTSHRSLSDSVEWVMRRLRR